MDSKELEKRKEATAKNARAELVKSGIIQFRIEPARLRYLYELADAKKMRVSAMVREWINERIDEEQMSTKQQGKSRAQANSMNQFGHRLTQLERHVRMLMKKLEA